MVLIVDEVSAANRKQGWISLTAVLLSDFRITRKDGIHAGLVPARMTALEYRFAEVEARDGGSVLSGVAMPYGSTARIAGVFDERVEPGAFSGSLDDVVLNRMHERSDIIARTGGGGLVLDDDASRLHLRADVPEYRADVRDQVARRILRGLSVEMVVVDQDWPTPDSRIIRTAELRGIAVVDRPAYDSTTLSIAKRARDGGVEGPMVADRGVSALRRWAEKYVIVGDGPRTGKRWKPGGAPWAEVLDAMDDRTLEQVTVRGSVQSGKTASLLVAALGHFAAGRSVLFFEPDEALKRAMSARVRSWSRRCRDPVVAEAWETPRPPHHRTNAAGGRLEVLSAGQRTGTLMRTAEIVILDELRAFGRDIVLELVDRMAAYGGKGRLIYRFVRRRRRSLPHDDRAREVGREVLVRSLPCVRTVGSGAVVERRHREGGGPAARLRHAVLQGDARDDGAQARRCGRGVAGDPHGRRAGDPGLPRRLLPLPIRDPRHDHAGMEAREPSSQANVEHGRGPGVPTRPPRPARSNPSPPGA